MNSHFIKPALSSLFYLGISFSIINFQATAAPSPIIAAASSTQFALEKIQQAFTLETGLNIKISYASSGNLSRQIIQGAPFELFISADESYVTQLIKQGLTLDSGKLYATGRLALFIPHHSDIKLDKELLYIKKALKQQRLKHFAIANPQHAPYGRAAKDLLINTGIWNELEKKLVLGENVAQAAQFASSGSAQAGIISYSLAISPALKSLGEYILLPQSLHRPFHARLVLLKQAKSTAKAFYQFLQTKKARLIFDRYGFIMPNKILN